MKRVVGVVSGMVIAAGAMAQSDVITQRKDLMKANGAATRARDPNGPRRSSLRSRQGQ